MQQAARKRRNWTGLLKLWRHRIWEGKGCLSVSVRVRACSNHADSAADTADLCSRGRLFFLLHCITLTFVHHSDWVSWEITADVTPGACLYAQKNVFCIEFQSVCIVHHSTSRASIPTSCYVCLLLAKAVLSWANPATIFHQGLETAWSGGFLCVIWVLLLFMVEVKVIIVTHGNPRHTGGKTAPQGDSGEKGLACDAPAGCAHADGPKQRRTHRRTDCWTQTHTRAHRDMARHTDIAPGLSLIDLDLFHWDPLSLNHVRHNTDTHTKTFRHILCLWNTHTENIIT